jgi:hypothetical protein
MERGERIKNKKNNRRQEKEKEEDREGFKVWDTV